MHTPNELLADLTAPQREAVTHTDGPLLVLAGAGSGKTRVITRRAAYLAATVTEPRHVLAITFTNKAADEMRERIAALGLADEMTVCTFHAFCARLLRHWAEPAGLPRDFAIFDQQDRYEALREAVRECGLTPENFPPSRIEPVISRAKNRLIDARAFAEQAATWEDRTLARIYEAYEAVLARQHALDFDDLLFRAARLLEDNDLRLRIADRFRYLLIDEYQDTNHAQYVLARRLAEPHRNLCATGDPDQSIYGWRGADLTNILDFERDFPDARVVRLEQNYRSTAPILEAASAVIAANRLRPPKRLWTQRTGGEPVRLLLASTAEHEAALIAEEIATLTARDYRPADIAILYRLNAMTRVLEEALRQRGIPYRIVRGVEFYRRKEIRDLLAYLRLLINPADDLACRRALASPRCGIGPATIERLETEARRLARPLLSLITDPPASLRRGRTPAALARFAERLRTVRRAPRQPVEEALRWILLHSGLEADLRSTAQREPERLENIDELLNAAATFDRLHPGATVADFLERVALVSDQDDVDPAAGAVLLMTLHAAKGLEFPVVFLVGLEDGTLPHARYRDDPAQLEEERRLCFVGMTRARHRLYLSCARYRTLAGITQRMAPSPFLRDLPDSVVRSPEPADEPEPARSAPPDLRPGETVVHPDYGPGRVTWIRPEPAQTRVGVEFETVGERTFLLEYARLHRPDDRKDQTR